jgi:regulatory protein
MNRITAIEQKKGKSDRWSVYVDGRHCLDCSAKLSSQYDLKVGDILEPERMEQLQQADELAEAKRQAVRLLGHRARTEVDLKKRLQQKNKFAEHTVDKTVAWLAEQGYLNDTRYATDRVNSLLGRSKMGRNGLAARLIAEGVERQLARQTAEQTVTAAEERQWAHQIAQDRARQMSSKPWQTVKRNIWGYLNRRGFDSEIIWDAIQALESDPDAM